ncbi:hypothetical protein PRIC1_004242 [Phytophthora ramorum]
MSYLSGRLELPHPPNFIKEIFIGEHLAILEDMHETYFNAALTVAVPATVRLTKNTAHATIFKELFQANTDKHTGHAMMRTFQRDVKRISFDGVQTLTVVFYARSAAARWKMKALRMQKAVLVLQDTSRAPGEEGTGLYSAPQLELQYAVRLYGGGQLGLVAIARTFAQIAGAKVLDVEYARATRTEIYDNRYHTIRFAQRVCPEPLRNVTRIMLGSTEVTLHHFQQHLRRPCARYFLPWHGTAKCTLANSKVAAARAKATRIASGAVEKVLPAPKVQFCVDSVTQLVEMMKSYHPQ